jgi:hypothetical protein
VLALLFDALRFAILGVLRLRVVILIQVLQTGSSLPRTQGAHFGLSVAGHSLAHNCQGWLALSVQTEMLVLAPRVGAPIYVSITSLDCMRTTGRSVATFLFLCDVRFESSLLAPFFKVGRTRPPLHPLVTDMKSAICKLAKRKVFKRCIAQLPFSLTLLLC